MDDDDLDIDEKSFSFRLFNRDALLQSVNTQQLSFPKIPIDPSSFLVGDELHFPLYQETDAPKKRGRKKKVQPTKDTMDPKITIREIIDNDQFGEPTEDEKRRQEEKIRKMKERRAKGKQQQAPEDAASRETGAQPSKQQRNSNINEEYTPFTQALLTFKDGKVVMEQNLIPLPNLSDKVHQLTTTKPKTLNSMSFRQKAHSKKWNEQENREFFKLLKICGTDFSMMAKIFETRSRNEVKSKFLREERQNRAMIDDSLKKNKKYNTKLLTSPFTQSIPKQITNSAMPEEQSSRALALSGSKNGDENDDFFKKPNIINTISGTSSIDSVDIRIISKLKNLLNEELTLSSRSPSQIGLTGLARPPGPERKNSHDLDEIPIVNGNPVIFAKSKPDVAQSNGHSYLEVSTHDTTLETTETRNSIYKPSNEQDTRVQGPKNLFFM